MDRRGRGERGNPEYPRRESALATKRVIARLGDIAELCKHLSFDDSISKGRFFYKRAREESEVPRKADKMRPQSGETRKEVFVMEQRTVEMQQRFAVEKRSAGLSASEVMLVGVLLAAGAVLKFFVGSMFSMGMKPNFIIAMYCLAILLIRPRFREAAAIGLLAGAVCQFFPGTPYINFASELSGALVMAAFACVTPKSGKMRVLPMVATFVSTLVSGFAFIGAMYLVFYAGANVKPVPLAVFMGIIFGTAAVNAVIVQILYTPLKLTLKR